MNEVKVRFPCEHGHWFKHVAEFAPKWVWCDGGTTKRLRSEYEYIGRVVWVEVDDE